MTATPQPTVDPPPPARSAGARAASSPSSSASCSCCPASGCCSAAGSCSGPTGRRATTTATCSRRRTTSPRSGLRHHQRAASTWPPARTGCRSPRRSGTARIEVTGADSGSDIFVGIAPVADTTAYLDGVERTHRRPTWARGSPPAIRTGAGAPSAPPGEQDFWVAQASGLGHADADLEAGGRQLDARGHERRRLGRGVRRRPHRCDRAGPRRARLGGARRRRCSCC